MNIVHRSRFTGVNRLIDGSIEPHLDAFKQHLADDRYASSTVASYLSDIAHFAPRSAVSFTA